MPQPTARLDFTRRPIVDQFAALSPGIATNAEGLSTTDDTQ